MCFSNNLPNIDKYNVDEKQFCLLFIKAYKISNKSITDSQNEDLEMNFQNHLKIMYLQMKLIMIMIIIIPLTM